MPDILADGERNLRKRLTTGAGLVIYPYSPDGPAGRNEMTTNTSAPVDVLAVMDNLWLSRGTAQGTDYRQARAAVAI